MVEIIALDDIGVRFGTITPRRQFLFRRLKLVIDQLLATQSAKKIYLFGSFVSGKASPNDVDLLVIMSAGFSTTRLHGKVLEVFQHDVCRIRYQTDVFWVTEAVGSDRIEDLLQVFSHDRLGQIQPVVEVRL
jgi:predicted nucleotidyltransferase